MHKLGEMSELTPFSGHEPPLPVEGLTWAVLLGKWVDFARSALALPDHEAGRKLRDAVPDMIGLQAVWFALGGVGELAEDQRQLGMDRAGVLIEQHAAALEARWAGQPLPPQLDELIRDARDRLRSARRGITEPGP